jgi:hypothetical protein
MDFGTDFKTITPLSFAAMLDGKAKDAVPQEEAREGRRGFMSRIHRRRFACLKAAEDAVDVLPDEGESLHAIMSGFYDLMHLLIVLLGRFRSPCQSMRIGTLSLSRRNVQEMVALFDQGKVRGLDLLCSDFFRKHDDDIFAELVQEFRSRGQRVGSARSHAKVVAVALDDGRRYVLEGSANLRTNRNQEQFALTRSRDLWTFYDAWIQEMVTTHAVHN